MKFKGFTGGCPFIMEPADSAKFSGEAIRVFEHKCKEENLEKMEMSTLGLDAFFARETFYNLGVQLTNLGFIEGNQVRLRSPVHIWKNTTIFLIVFGE